MAESNQWYAVLSKKEDFETTIYDIVATIHPTETQFKRDYYKPESEGVNDPALKNDYPYILFQGDKKGCIDYLDYLEEINKK